MEDTLMKKYRTALGNNIKRASLQVFLFRAAIFVSLLVGGRTTKADLLVASSNSDNVLRYNETTGAFIGAFVPAASGGLDFTIGLTMGPDGNLYVGSHYSNSILRYSGATGTFLGTLVSSGSGGLNGVTGLAFGPDLNLYVGSPF